MSCWRLSVTEAEKLSLLMIPVSIFKSYAILILYMTHMGSPLLKLDGKWWLDTNSDGIPNLDYWTLWFYANNNMRCHTGWNLSSAWCTDRLVKEIPKTLTALIASWFPHVVTSYPRPRRSSLVGWEMEVLLRRDGSLS